jgi:hypothetical protein
LIPFIILLLFPLRTTGILAPNHGPRDSNGLELPAAFFSQPSPAQINHQSNQNNNNNNIQSQPSITNYTRQTQSQSLTGNDRRFSEMGAARGRDRPDKFVELGERGRLVYSLIFPFLDQASSASLSNNLTDSSYITSFKLEKLGS